jgi:hypothetical protein
MSGAVHTAPGDELKIFGAHPGSFEVKLWHNITVTTWFGPATPSAALKLSELTKVLMTTLPPEQRISVIHLVAPKLELPSNEVRTLFLQPLQQYADRFGCVSVIVGGTGFWTSAMRGFITGMRVLAPRTFDLRLHADAESLLEWFPEEHQKRTGFQIDPNALAAILAQATTMQQAAVAARG